MNLRPLLLPFLSFAVGAIVPVLYRSVSGEQGAASGRGGGAVPERSVAGKSSGGAKSIHVTGDAAVSVETLAFAGLRDRPTLDDIFNATGMDRPLRIALFLQTATSADLAMLIERGKKEWTYDTSLTDQIWLRWVEIDREAAFKADPGGQVVCWAWAKLDPGAAVAAAAGNPEHLRSVIRAIGQGDQDAAIRLLSEYPAADTPEVWEGILSGIAKTDRGAAAALALEKNLKLEEYVGSWVAREPEAALTWARGLEDPVQRRRVMDLAVQELITADPRAALAELERLPAGRSRTERTAEALSALSRTDPAAARAAAESLPNPTDRQRALADLTETLAARDPAAALDILKDLSWADSATAVLEHNSIRQLMQSAPEATADLLAALPPERAAPISQAIRQWTASQPEAASRWLTGLPAGKVKDNAITGLTQWLTQESPEPDFEAALAWGAAASTPEHQFNSMKQTLSTWQNRDWKSARAAVDRLHLTPEQRTQLLQFFSNYPENP